MTLNEAESLKQKFEELILRNRPNETKNIEILVGPSHETDFSAFLKMWRNSTYVVALTTFAHCDMNVFICDKDYVRTQDDFETIEEFSKRTGMRFS